MTLLHAGEHEGLKLAVHGLLGLLAGVCAVYNGGAFLARPCRDRRLVGNVLVYAALAAFEVHQVHHHAQRLTTAHQGQE